MSRGSPRNRTKRVTWFTHILIGWPFFSLSRFISVFSFALLIIAIFRKGTPIRKILKYLHVYTHTYIDTHTYFPIGRYAGEEEVNSHTHTHTHTHTHIYIYIYISLITKLPTQKRKHLMRKNACWKYCEILSELGTKNNLPFLSEVLNTMNTVIHIWLFYNYTLICMKFIDTKHRHR